MVQASPLNPQSPQGGQLLHGDDRYTAVALIAGAVSYNRDATSQAMSIITLN